jgi:hypothetical protein
MKAATTKARKSPPVNAKSRSRPKFGFRSSRAMTVRTGRATALAIKINKKGVVRYHSFFVLISNQSIVAPHPAP